MRIQDKKIFFSLYSEACQKCFGLSLSEPLSDADSKILSNRILEQTGLVIGAKSIKNYSAFLLKTIPGRPREENPSTATLDTLARYVLNAPYTDELKRKNFESHYPYWYDYRNRFSNKKSAGEKLLVSRKTFAIVLIAVLISVTSLFIIKMHLHRAGKSYFRDNFNSVNEDSLVDKGWIVKSVDTTWWNMRGERPGHLALYTLRGDNWSLGNNKPLIRNLLMHKINSECFTVEISLSDFIPMHNWQQAGLLLSEDSSFSGKMIRLSISYNDFFGGVPKSPEIIIQAISSSESGSLSKPEEIAHYPLFTIEPGKENIVSSNLSRSALKIEKRGTHFRFLYSISEKESFAFREALSGNFNIRPEFVSIFAIQGWSDNELIPAYFDSFMLDTSPCAR